MNQLDVQNRINAGLAVAARVLGQPFNAFRPLDVFAQLSGPPWTVMGVIDRDPDRMLRAPAGYGDVTRYFLGDASSLRAGDILVNESHTYFVAGIEGFSAPMVVDCNASVSIADLQQSAAYGGSVESVIADGWPASLRLSGLAGDRLTGLRDSPGEAIFSLLLPLLPGLALRSGMRVLDGQGQHLQLTGVESTALGYRASARLCDA